MLKGMFTALLLISSNLLLAQATITGHVTDAETNEKLAYVNIGILDTSKGTVTDGEGNFKITVDSSSDILVFSYVGYETQKRAVEFTDKPITVSLKQNSVLVQEVKIIGSSFDKEMLLGAKNTKGRGNSIGFGNAQLGTELGAVINIEKETFIKSINFVLNHAKGDSLLLRMNIYSFTDGRIGDKVLDQNIYIKEKQRKGVYSINVEAHEIILEENVLLTIEWLRDFDEEGNKLITFDTKKSRKYGGTYVRFSNTSEFVRLPYKKKHKPCIYFVGKQSAN